MFHLVCLYQKKIYYILEAYDLPKARLACDFYEKMYPKAQFDFLAGIKRYQIEQLDSGQKFSRDYNTKEYLRTIEG